VRYLLLIGFFNQFWWKMFARSLITAAMEKQGAKRFTKVKNRS